MRKLLVDFLVRLFEASGHGLLHLVDDILELLLGEAEVLELRLQKCRLLADTLVFLQRSEIDLAETSDLVFQRFKTGWRILGVELKICFGDGNIRRKTEGFQKLLLKLVELFCSTLEPHLRGAVRAPAIVARAARLADGFIPLADVFFQRIDARLRFLHGGIDSEVAVLRCFQRCALVVETRAEAGQLFSKLSAVRFLLRHCLLQARCFADSCRVALALMLHLLVARRLLHEHALQRCLRRLLGALRLAKIAARLRQILGEGFQLNAERFCRFFRTREILLRCRTLGAEAVAIHALELQLTLHTFHLRLLLFEDDSDLAQRQLLLLLARIAALLRLRELFQLRLKLRRRIDDLRCFGSEGSDLILQRAHFVLAVDNRALLFLMPAGHTAARREHVAIQRHKAMLRASALGQRRRAREIAQHPDAAEKLRHHSFVFRIVLH